MLIIRSAIIKIPVIIKIKSLTLLTIFISLKKFLLLSGIIKTLNKISILLKINKLAVIFGNKLYNSKNIITIDMILYKERSSKVTAIIKYTELFVRLDNNIKTTANIVITDKFITGTNNSAILMLYPNIKVVNKSIINLYVVLECSLIILSKLSEYSISCSFSLFNFPLTDSKSSEVARSLFMSRIRFFISVFCAEAFSEISII